MALTDILRRVESGIEPDEELDLDLAVAVGFLKVDAQGRRYREKDGERLYGGLNDRVLVRRFTRDADAVDRLIDEVFAPRHPEMVIRSRAVRGQIFREGAGWFYFEEITVPSREFQGRATNRARARLAALIRGLICDEEDARRRA